MTLLVKLYINILSFFGVDETIAKQEDVMILFMIFIIT